MIFYYPVNIDIFFLKVFFNNFLERFDERCYQLDISVRFHCEIVDFLFLFLIWMFIKNMMFHSKSNEKRYARECKVKIKFLEKSKLKGQKFDRSFVNVAKFLLFSMTHPLVFHTFEIRDESVLLKLRAYI